MISDAMQTGTVQINAAPARGPDHFPFQVRTVGRLASRACAAVASFHTSTLACPRRLPSRASAAGALFHSSLPHLPPSPPEQGFRDSGIGSQGITNSLQMMVKTKSTVINLQGESYAMG
eukprot:364528-Chlamydomonas_euryale.AAC.2